MSAGQFPILLLLGCLLSGLVGAAAGAWWCSRRVQQVLCAQLRLALHELAPWPIEPQRPADRPERDAQSIQAVRQAIQVELEFQERQLAERDRARAEEQRLWQTDHDERRAAEFRALLHAMSAQSAISTAAPVRHRGPACALAPAPSVSARPPEMMQTPLPRPAPSYAADAPEIELSDEEIDALPAEPPEPNPARKRILPAPKKPVMREL